MFTDIKKYILIDISNNNTSRLMRYIKSQRLCMENVCTPN